MHRPSLARFWFTLLLAVAACGGGKTDQAPAAAAAPPADGGLTPFQLENGIGPVKEALTLGPVDKELSEKGEAIFQGKCSACHKMAERYVGPALGDVTKRRAPAYILNMILNPEEMYTKHPAAKQLLAEHMTQMPNLALSQDEARQVLEYLRTQATTKADE
jgi:mono/diheme cytochrome c family protein